MRKSSENGYSLIEVLAGLLIFSVGALASGVLIVTSLHLNQRSREQSVAASLVAQRLEELRSRPWIDAGGGDDLKPGGAVLSDDALRTSGEPSLDSSFSETFNSDISGPKRSTKETYYIVMWSIQDLVDSGLDFKRITIKGVALNWRGGENRWEPAAAFDHIAMVFREIKVE